MEKLNETLRVLHDTDQPLSANAIYSLSDMEKDDLERLSAAWGAIPVERRRSLVRRLAEAAETNFELDFGAFTRLALTDLDDEVREAAVEASWTDESPDIARRLINMASGDIAPGVRAAAVSALGRFILLGELGKFDSSLARRAENVAIKLYNDPNEDVDVRRRALEAAANCGRAGVDDMINEAYNGSNNRMRISAVFAMGRSCDPQWAQIVLRELASDDPEMRYEAARSAGELEIKQAIPYLAEMLHVGDREIMEVAIWSLGEIGGDQARRLLEDVIEQAEEVEDADLAEAAEEALQSAALVGDDLAL